MNCAPKYGQLTCGTSIGVSKKDEACEEGCYCPEGTVLYDGKCIRRDQCSCRLRGRTFPPGSVVPKDCNSCECIAGVWKCTQVWQKYIF